MPYLVPILIIAVIVYLMVVFIIPLTVILITHLVIGSAANFGETEVVILGHVFYWVTGLLFAGAVLFNYDLSGAKEFWAFVGMVLLWPFSLFHLEFGQPDGGLKLKVILGVCGFVFTQLAAVFIMIAKTRGWLKFPDPGAPFWKR